MNLLDAWLQRRTTIISVLLILIVLIAALLPSLQFGPSRAVGAAVFSISIEYFGVDAEEMERRISIPLEDAISPLPGIQRLRSTSEYGKSVVEATLFPATAPDKFYLALRDAVHTLCASFPKAVQRPVIQSTASGQRPSLIATVLLEGATLDETRDLVEKTVKPGLEQIDGVGDLEVGGGSQREVHVLVDQKKAAAAGLSFNDIASILQAQYLSRPIGRLRTAATDTPIILDGRYDSLEQLAALALVLQKNRTVRLGEVAAVSYGGRELDAISRIDQQQRVTLYVTCSGTANVVAVSQAIRRKLAALSRPALSFDVVYDLGAEIAESIQEVLRSLAIAAAIVAFFVGAVLRPLRNAALLALLLPFVVLASAALLSSAGLSIDHNILAGIGVGIGMIVDPGIIMLSALVGWQGHSLRRSTGETVKELVSPLVASVATIVIVLVPLSYMGRSVSGLAEVSYALAIMLSVSLACALLFLPSFAARERRSPGHFPPRRHGIVLIALDQRRIIARRAGRTVDFLVAWAGAHSLAVLAGTAAVCAMGVLAGFQMDLVLTPAPSPHSVYAHIEFESGTRIDTIDRRTAWLAGQIEGMRGVSHVETIARRESSELTATMEGDADDRVRVREALVERGRHIMDAFVYLPEGASGADQAIEVSLIGPDNATLRDTAKQVADSLRGSPWVSQVVLNFKEGPPAYILAIDHDTASGCNLSTAAIANTLRWSMHGPVALKWFEPDSQEIDLRVQSGPAERGDLSAIKRTSIIGPQGHVVSVGELGAFQRAQPPSRIFRVDRQRAVSFTAHSGIRDTGIVLKNLETFLASVALPSGYAFRIDRLLYDRLRQFQTLAMLFIAALFLVFITLAAQMESLSSPLLVISIVPVALSVPLGFLWLTHAGIDVSVIVSLIIMSGIIVNNAILVVDRTLKRCAGLDSYSAGEVRRSLRYAVRRRTRALFLTSATTLLGVAPFLLGASTGSELFRPLAVVVFWGTVASVVATFLVLPAIAAAAPVFARRFPAVRR
ncbi:MAG: efflux RND transporter permease subunit [Spirochaetia bacterium]|jgi:multidrug efflux pump subunit AcrB